MKLTSDEATVIINPEQGGRIASFEVFGNELLVTNSDDPVTWGCYPMVPFAGRIESGVLQFAGESYQLPANDTPHALHGYGFTSAWQQVSETELLYDFQQPWPFAGFATQRFNLTDSALTLTMTATAYEIQPLILGWHPWFKREVSGHQVQLEFAADWMFELDERLIPTCGIVTPPPGPWDNCFTGIRSEPVLRWGDLSLALSSSTDYWVVYDKPEHALCVEPQTAPPNSINHDDADVVGTKSTHEVQFTMRWAKR